MYGDKSREYSASNVIENEFLQFEHLVGNISKKTTVAERFALWALVMRSRVRFPVYPKRETEMSKRFWWGCSGQRIGMNFFALVLKVQGIPQFDTW